MSAFSDYNDEVRKRVDELFSPVEVQLVADDFVDRGHFPHSFDEIEAVGNEIMRDVDNR